MKTEEMNLLAARINFVCTLAQLRALGEEEAASSLESEVSYFMEKYGANEDQY